MKIRTQVKCLIVFLVAAFFFSSSSIASEKASVRYIHFPVRANIGRLDSPDDRDFQEAARAAVPVPTDARVRLHVNENPKDLPALAQLGPADLQMLNFYDCKIGDAELVCIKGLTSLQGLNLSGTNVTDSGLTHIAHLESLETLNLNGLEITDAGLAKLKNLNSLKALQVSGAAITDAGLAHFEDLSRLESLSLGGTAITDASLALIKDSSALRILDLHGTRISDAGLAQLSNLTSLDTLDLGYTDIGDAGLAHLAHLPSLKSLRLHETNVTDAGLANLKELTSLQYLTLSGLDIDGSGLDALSSLESLRYLSLNDTRVDDAALTHLAGLKSIDNLCLNNTRISDTGLAHLKELPELSFVEILGTATTPEGLWLPGRHSFVETDRPPPSGYPYDDDWLLRPPKMVALVFLIICFISLPLCNLALLRYKTRIFLSLIGMFAWCFSVPYLPIMVSVFHWRSLSALEMRNILFTASDMPPTIVYLMLSYVNGTALAFQHDVELTFIRSAESKWKTVIARAAAGVAMFVSISAAVGFLLFLQNGEGLVSILILVLGLIFGLTMGLANSLLFSWISSKTGKSIVPFRLRKERSRNEAKTGEAVQNSVISDKT